MRDYYTDVTNDPDDYARAEQCYNCGALMTTGGRECDCGVECR